jgi:ribose/xylose/arabinose/galactoside ABC-type transport system permease subunit
MSVAAPQARRRLVGRGRSRDQRWMAALAVLLVLELAYFSVTATGFWGGGTGMLDQTEYFLDIGVMAIGVGFVIFAGDIDLSCGAMASFVGILMAELWKAGLEIWLAALVAVLVAAAIGLLQGLIITLFRLESLLVTLASQFILGSLATALGGGYPPYGFPSSFESIAGTGSIGPIPAQIVEFAILGVVAFVLVHRTAFGRSLVLLGHNREAARYAGVDVTRTRVLAFVLSAAFAALAGVLIAGTYNTVRDDLGDSLLLPAITIVVLGGVDIFGGRGHMAGVVFAAFVLGFLYQGLLIDGVSQLTANMVGGVVLVVALGIKLALERRSGGAKVTERLRLRFARAGPP